MLTKTLRFDDDVIAVIKAMNWADDGCLGVITGGQLARDLYTRVNKALEAMGGKWNRKWGGHVFAADPRPSVEGLIDNGSLTVERDGFFETPIEVVNKMLELAPYTGGYVLEPSAGMGAIALNLGVPTDMIVCVEKNADRCKSLVDKKFAAVINADFLTYPAYDHIWKISHVYMNPPFEELQDIDHVKHAYELLAIGGTLVAVMSESPFFRTDKKAEEFRLWYDRLDSYVEKLPAGSFKESGTGVNARLVVINK